MRLSDVLGALDMPWYPIIGMVMFLSVFVAACVRVFRESRGEIVRCAGLPLNDDGPKVELNGARKASGGAKKDAAAEGGAG